MAMMTLLFIAKLGNKKYFLKKMSSLRNHPKWSLIFLMSLLIWEKKPCTFPHSFKNQAYSHGLSYYFQFMGSFLGSIPNCMKTERDRKIFVPWNSFFTALSFGVNPKWIMTGVVQILFSSHWTLVIINKQFMRYSMSIFLCNKTSLKCKTIKMSGICMV